MPEIRISVGERTYTVACQEGEEVHLRSAASALDDEAKIVQKSAPNVSEAQLLLMAGLMLADKMTSTGTQGEYADQQISDLQGKLIVSEKKANELQQQIANLSSAPPSQNDQELAVLERMATELERLADEMEAASA